jgi:uncharacterized protein YjbJ (UPF0337 family)
VITHHLGVKHDCHYAPGLADSSHWYAFGVARETSHTISGREATMSAEDKANNKIEDLGGKAKEGLGKLTGDKDTENEGQADQVKSSLKDAGEKVKDAFKSD